MCSFPSDRRGGVGVRRKADGETESQDKSLFWPQNLILLDAG